MAPEQLKQARLIRKHYGLTRPVTLAEVEAEIANLQRKAANGTMDDSQEHLYAALDLDELAPLAGESYQEWPPYSMDNLSA